MLYHSVVLRERVFDWQGGPLTIVRVLEGPGGPLLWEPVGTVECVPLAHGLALPARLDPVRVSVRGEPVAEVEVGVVAGRPACVAVRALPGHELTTRLLRQLPGLGRIVRAVAAAETVRVVRADSELVGERYVDAEGSGFDAPRREVVRETEALLERRARRSLDDEFLREVAEVYRDALARGASTQRAIRERWPTTEANARRWVARARQAGHLGPAPGRRRGGETRPEGGDHA
jgi:hypothetical protein